MNYHDFLKSKVIDHKPSGFEVDLNDLNPILFDWQKAIVKWALIKGKACLWEDCGLGKTPQQLEWAKHVYLETKEDVLILAPLAVSHQTKREGLKFGINVNVCRSQNDVKSGINITNYEILHKFDPEKFIGIVLDESSILKSYTGKYRNDIISAFNQTPYKLACTATPAPNDYMEIGNHSEFLNVLTRSEMLSSFFINDASDTGTWRLKGHAQHKFWEWICSWAIMINKPSDIGFEDNGFILPPIHYHEHIINHGKPLPGKLFVENASSLSERRQARRSSLEDRCKKALEIIESNPNEPWLIWCDLNDESKMLSSLIPNCVEVKGADSNEHKTDSLIGFSDGTIDRLCSKSRIAGWGMNFQRCPNAVFVGLSDSYEAFYQASRRIWRFGQKNEVHIHIVTADIEGSVLQNIKRKEDDFIRMRNEMVKNMADISKTELKSKETNIVKYTPKSENGNGWTMYNGDCVEIIKSIPEESIHYSIFSPPFASLYTYSDSERDMGNCKTDEEFMEHFKFLLPELYRVLIPGRLVSIHCMNIPALKSKDGYIGIKDFRGDIIRCFTDTGWIFHSEVCIWKDPLIQAVRTKMLALAHKQISKDSSRCAMGFPDYIVTMRKPGTNPEPVSHGRGFERYIGEMDEPKAQKNNDARTNKYSHEVWQRYASPVWFDIRQTNTLNIQAARSEKDEKHICPLQIDVIEKCLELWTNQGDMVLSPFAGIGSEGYVSLKIGRGFTGIELKKSYYEQAIRNLYQVENGGQQRKLF